MQNGQLDPTCSELHGENSEPTDGEHSDGGAESGEEEAEVVRPLPDLGLEGLLFRWAGGQLTTIPCIGSCLWLVAPLMPSSPAGSATITIVSIGGIRHVGTQQVLVRGGCSSLGGS